MAKTHDWSLNNVYTDAIGGLTLTPSNSPTAVGSNTGFLFNGTNQHAENTAYTKPSGSRTLIVWILAKATGIANGRFVANGDAVASSDQIGTSSASALNFRLGTRRATGGSAHTFSTVTKTMLAAVFNGSTTTGYYALEGAGSVTVVADTAAVTETTVNRIAVARNTNVANYTNVEIYRVIEFNTALSEAEINEWLAAGSESDPVSDAITITTPAQYKTLQRNGSNQANITITGTYTGTPTAIEASFNGGAYATIVASPAGGTFSGTLSNQAAGQGTLTVRFTNDTAINATKADIGIGDVFVVAGQSNAEGRGTNARSYSHATLKATVFRQDDAWANGNDPTDTLTANGSPWPLLATLLMAQTGFPVAFITTAAGDSKLYLDTWTEPGAAYTDCVQTIANSGVNDVKAVLWHQGESDANDGVTAVQYAPALSDFLDDLQADTGFSAMKLVCANLGFKTTGSVSREDVDQIRLGQLNAVANDADILPGPMLYDIDLGDGAGDGVHFKTDAEMLLLAQRWWRCLYVAFFSGTESARGPQFASATRDGDAVTVTFSGGQGSLAGQTNTIGWRVTDDGTPVTVSSAAASGSNAVVLTLASAPTGTVLVSFGSFNDAAGSTLKDSGTYPLPPELFVEQAITEEGEEPELPTERQFDAELVHFAATRRFDAEEVYVSSVRRFDTDEVHTVNSRRASAREVYEVSSPSRANRKVYVSGSE